MQSSIDAEIRDQVNRYVTGAITLGEFRDWFVPRAWDIENQGNTATEELAYEIELRLAEFSDGHLTEENLKEALSQAVENRFDIALTVGTANLGTLRVFEPSASTSDSFARLKPVLSR